MDEKQPLTRTDALKRIAVVPVAAAGITAAVAAPAEAKTSQQAAAYVNHPKGDQECDKCRFFQKPNGCMIVAGKISPKGWCKFYVKK